MKLKLKKGYNDTTPIFRKRLIRGYIKLST